MRYLSKILLAARCSLDVPFPPERDMHISHLSASTHTKHIRTRAHSAAGHQIIVDIPTFASPYLRHSAMTVFQCEGASRSTASIEPAPHEVHMTY